MKERPNVSDLADELMWLDTLTIAEEWHNIDFVLSSLDVTEEHPVTIIGYIRWTFPLNTKLREWQPLLQKFCDHLKETRQEHKKILQGLEQYYNDMG